MIEIKKGIPMPPAKGVGTGISQALKIMEVGDCISLIAVTQSAIHGYFTGHKPKKFATRKTPEGLNIWRIE